MRSENELRVCRKWMAKVIFGLSFAILSYGVLFFDLIRKGME